MYESSQLKLGRNFCQNSENIEKFSDNFRSYWQQFRLSLFTFVPLINPICPKYTQAWPKLLPIRLKLFKNFSTLSEIQWNLLTNFRWLRLHTVELCHKAEIGPKLKNYFGNMHTLNRFYRSNYMAKIFFNPSAVDLMVFIVRKFRSANSNPDPEFLNKTAFQI
jgi:hypothetical protein